jgi:hypothetical protein
LFLKKFRERGCDGTHEPTLNDGLVRSNLLITAVEEKGEREKNRFKLRPQLWRHCLSKKSPFWLLLLLLLLKVWAEIVGQFRIEKENKIFEKISRANYF